MIYRLLTKLQEWSARPGTREAYTVTTLHEDGTVSTWQLLPRGGEA